jgi:hypothetical protein
LLVYSTLQANVMMEQVWDCAGMSAACVAVLSKILRIKQVLIFLAKRMHMKIELAGAMSIQIQS